MHHQAWGLIQGRYRNIFKGGDSKALQAAGKTGVSNFGVRGLIYEVAFAGGMGTVIEVEKQNIYSFFDYLSYLRAQLEYKNELIK